MKATITINIVDGKRERAESIGLELPAASMKEQLSILAMTTLPVTIQEMFESDGWVVTPAKVKKK